MSTKAIGKKYSVCQGTVHYRIKNKTEMRTQCELRKFKWTQEQLDKMIWLRANGYCIAAIADWFEVCYSTIYRIFKGEGSHK